LCPSPEDDLNAIQTLGVVHRGVHSNGVTRGCRKSFRSDETQGGYCFRSSMRKQEENMKR
ncbi:MAG: hypothetical protein ACRD1G_21105, partial [Acidimicrobiales bacterium]